jgi:hypothetical protein
MRRKRKKRRKRGREEGGTRKRTWKLNEDFEARAR